MEVPIVVARVDEAVPIVFFVFLFLIIAISLFLKNRERGRRHTERLKAMELGMQVPLDAPEPPRQPKFVLGFGILLISLAVPLAIIAGFLLPIIDNDRTPTLGFSLCLFSLGIGFLVWYALTKPKA